MTALSPLPIQKFFSNNGEPLVGGLLFTYTAGTSTKIATYTDSTGLSVNTNPIVLNYRGEANVWLDPTLTYKFVLSPANDTDPPTKPIWTVDNISAFGGLTPEIIGRLIYPQIPAEVAAGAVILNYTYPWGYVLRYGTNTSPGTTDMTVAIQTAVNVALQNTGLSPGVATLPEDILLITASIEINNQSGSGFYRPSLVIVGAGEAKTRVLNRSSGAAFKHTLTQTQGDNNSFSRGLQISDLEIYGDGSSPAGSQGISLEGANNPWIHDILINAMGSHGIVTPFDARWGTSDRYSCADITLDRATIISCGGWALFNQAFATAYQVTSPYFVSNVGGGAYLEGSLHRFTKGSISGNGSSGVASSYGIHFARSTEGTPNGCVIVQTELDSNWNNQVRTNGVNTLIDRVQCADDATSGQFRALVQIQVIALTGQSADSNRIQYARFRFTTQGIANATAVSFDLNTVDGRTVRFNVHERPNILTSGSTGGVITPTSFGTNPNVSDSIGNKSYTNAAPQGTTFTGFTTRDISLASGTQAVTGVGFRPVGIYIQGAVFNTAITTNGYVDSTLGNRGFYYYPTTGIWADPTPDVLLFRTGAGDLYSGTVSSFDLDGFTITWTKTGAPTGTATVKFMAVK